MEDLDEAVITLTSLMHQSMEMEFTVVVLCDVQEVPVVMDVIARRNQYNHIQDCYFHVENTPKSNGKKSNLISFIILYFIYYFQTYNYVYFLLVMVDIIDCSSLVIITFILIVKILLVQQLMNQIQHPGYNNDAEGHK